MKKHALTPLAFAYIANELLQTFALAVVGGTSGSMLKSNQTIVSPALEAELVALVALDLRYHGKGLIGDLISYDKKCNIGITMVGMRLYFGKTDIPCLSI